MIICHHNCHSHRHGDRHPNADGHPYGGGQFHANAHRHCDPDRHADQLANAHGVAVEEYDPTSDTWAPRAGMSGGRESPGVAATNDGKIYVVGEALGIGIGRPSYLRTVLEGVLP
jgi:hypothetical protein